jgi:MFS family permease
VLVPALLLFAVAGAACTFARSLPMLLALRFVQGVGAAPLGSLNVTLIGDLYSGRQRTAAMGYNASVLSVGTAAYPAIGGALATLAWFYPFALALLAFPVAAMVAFRFHAPAPQPSQRLGAYLGRVWQEVRNRQVAVLFLASTVIFIVLYGAFLIFLPFLMAQRFASSPLDIGVLMSYQSVVTAITSACLGRMAIYATERTIACCGLVLVAAGLVTVPFAPSALALAVPAGLLGIGLASSIPVVQTILAGLAPDHRRAAFMSLNGMVLRLGQTLGPVLAAAVYAALGINSVFVVSAALSLALAGLLAWALRPTTSA